MKYNSSGNGPLRVKMTCVRQGEARSCSKIVLITNEIWQRHRHIQNIGQRKCDVTIDYVSRSQRSQWEANTPGRNSWSFQFFRYSATLLTWGRLEFPMNFKYRVLFLFFKLFAVLVNLLFVFFFSGFFLIFSVP